MATIKDTGSKIQVTMFIEPYSLFLACKKLWIENVMFGDLIEEYFKKKSKILFVLIWKDTNDSCNCSFTRKGS